VELGINYLDTAPGYGNSEEVLGQALKDIRQPLILSTKLGGRPKPFKPQDKSCLMASVEESLKLLGRDSIDILMIHEPDRPGQYDWWTDWQDVNGPVLELMGDLRKKGIIRHIGLGGTTAYVLAHLVRSGKFDIVLTAFNYSLLWREAACEILPAARENSVGVVIGSPLQQGALSRKYSETVDNEQVYWLSRARREQLKKLYAFVDECGISLPELGLRFVISNPDVHCVLMGARSAAEVEQNAAAVEKGPLPRDILKRLDEIAASVPYRPFEEPFGLGWMMASPMGYKGPGPAA
jgi:aryl-alcohol dehydrogenase-like predicted oxidoreductase